MNNENPHSTSPASPDDSTRSPVMVNDEINVSAVDSDDPIENAQMETAIDASIPANDDNAFIAMGITEPSYMANVPTGTVDHQPADWDPHITEPDAEVPYERSPGILHLNQDFEVLLSPAIQNVIVDFNTTDHDVFFLHERVTIAESVYHEENTIEITFTESIAVQTRDIPVPNPPIHNEIDNVLREPIVVIDLTNDHDDERQEILQVQPSLIRPPVLIDLTNSDDEEEEESEGCQTQIVLNVEQHNHPETGPPAIMTESTLPITAPSLEAEDPNPSTAATVDNSNNVIETAAHLQVPVSLPRTHKRAISSDELQRTDEKSAARRAKRCRTVN